MSTRGSGYAGEAIACDYLKKQGLKIIKRNYYTSAGEIDIIAEDGEYIIFVEVKARADTETQRRYGRPGSAVDAAKRKRLVSSAYDFLSRTRTKKKPRIDIMEIYISEYPDLKSVSAEIHWYKSAVGRGGRRV